MGTIKDARMESREGLDLQVRLARLETLVDVHLERGGTLDRLQSKVEGTNTRVLFLSGGITALLNALRFVATIFFK